MNWEIATGISSVVIAVCALAYTIWQGKQTQKHNKLSFRPHLTTWTHKDEKQCRYAVDIINNGLGPAIIQSFVVKVDSKVINGEGTDAIEKSLKILFQNTPYQSHQSFMAKGYSMAAKDKCTIVDIQFFGPAQPTREVIEHAFNRADLIIHYKSFYNEEFTYSSEVEKSNNQPS